MYHNNFVVQLFVVLKLTPSDQRSKTAIPIATEQQQQHKETRQKRTMELPGTKDSSGNDTTASNSNEEQIKESAPTTETIAAGLVKTKAIEVVHTSQSVDGAAITESGKYLSTTGVTSMPGKRDLAAPTSTSTTTSSSGMGIMGVHNAKRGKREWLSFRGSRQTRVGEDYQVASLPPVDNINTNTNTTTTTTNTDNTTPINGEGK